MIKNISKLEVKVSDRMYTLLCECDSPLVEVQEALLLMGGLIVQKLKDAEKPAEDENVQ